jgi:hypothetical protein
VGTGRRRAVAGIGGYVGSRRTHVCGRTPRRGDSADCVWFGTYGRAHDGWRSLYVEEVVEEGLCCSFVCYYLYSPNNTHSPESSAGHGDNGWKYLPRWTQSLAGHTVTCVTCGSYHTAAVTNRGDLYTWGGGMYGKLGHGKGAGCFTPKRVEGLVGVARRIGACLASCVCLLSCVCAFYKVTERTPWWSHTLSLFLYIECLRQPAHGRSDDYWSALHVGRQGEWSGWTWRYRSASIYTSTRRMFGGETPCPIVVGRFCV